MNSRDIHSKVLKNSCYQEEYIMSCMLESSKGGPYRGGTSEGVPYGGGMYFRRGLYRSVPYLPILSIVVMSSSTLLGAEMLCCSGRQLVLLLV